MFVGNLGARAIDPLDASMDLAQLVFMRDLV
jgi:hypothetical protein